MKFKSALAIPVIGLLAFASPVHADDDHGNPGAPGIQNPENHGPGDGRNFEHRIDDRHEGFEGIQFLIIGGALVVAVFLAYTAGKRSRKKSSKKKDEEL
jgi:hypothetical protein